MSKTEIMHVDVNAIAIKILSEFEEMLDRKDVTIPDSHRIGDPDEARLYGETYYEMEDKIIDILSEAIEKWRKEDGR